jgi:hypothetical protein
MPPASPDGVIPMKRTAVWVQRKLTGKAKPALGQTRRFERGKTLLQFT